MATVTMVVVMAMRVTVVLLVDVGVLLVTVLRPGVHVTFVMGVMRMFRAVRTMTVVMLVLGAHVVLRMVEMRLVVLIRTAVVVALAGRVAGVLAETSYEWLSFLHDCSFDV